MARLKTQVQVYQWKETKKEEKKKDNLGGGETTITKFEYNKVWSDTQINSASFNQPSHSNTISVSGLQCGTEELTNTTVKYGETGLKNCFFIVSFRAHIPRSNNHNYLLHHHRNESCGY